MGTQFSVGMFLHVPKSTEWSQQVNIVTVFKELQWKVITMESNIICSEILNLEISIQPMQVYRIQ